MSIYQSIRLAVRALGTNKLRASLTVLGIIIGVGAVIALVAVGQGAQKQITDNVQSLGTNLLFVRPGAGQSGGVRQAAGSVVTLTYEDGQAILESGQVPGVSAVAPDRTVPAQLVAGSQNWNTRVVGVTPSYEQVRNFSISDGDFITQRQFDAESRVIVLGPVTAQSLFGDEEPVGKNVKISVNGRVGENFKVVGVTTTKGSNAFGNDDDQGFIPLSTMEHRLFAQQTAQRSLNVTELNVQVSNPDLTDQVTSEIGDLLRQRHRVTQDDFTITSEADIVRFFVQVTDLFTLVLAAIAGISLLVGGIGIMNIMLVSVTERTREIGIRRAVGARRWDILMQFLLEAIAVSLIGGALGVFLGVLLTRIVSRIPVNGQVLTPIVSPGSVLIAFCVSASIGLFFGFYPAMRASRLNPIDALRYE